LFICAVLVEQMNFEDFIPMTGGQGDYAPALLSVLGQFYRSWMLIKGVNYASQDQVLVCSYVQYLWSK
jgi:hypothetical protein